MKTTKSLTITLLVLLATALNAAAATFVVTNADDSGPGSLRDALTHANSNAQADTINFAPEFFATARTIVLASELQITWDNANPGRLVTINGPGANLLTISGNNAVRPIYAGAYSSVAMSGITIRDGNGVGTVPPNAGTSGGGIMCNTCSLTLTNMVIRNNTVPDTGGGIYAVGGRSFTLVDSVVTENNANHGGGIWESSSNVKTIRNTTISNNVAKNDVGGATFNWETLTMENCVVTGNKAATFSGVSGGAGQSGGLSFYNVASGTVTDTVVSNNTAGFDLQGNAVTAGFYAGIHSDGGVMTFRRISVTGNRVAADPAKGVGVVGGMHLRVPGGPYTIIDSVISGNAGGNEGGGIATAHTGPVYIINTTIANNAARRGGGIRNHSDELTVINSTIAGNTAAPWTPEEANGGGGIMNLGSVRTRVQNSIIANNNAEDLRGGFISNGYNIIGNTAYSTGFGAPGDQLNVDPLLDPNGLQNNGGPTLTIALQSNSPAINAGSNALAVDRNGAALPFDQRGHPFERIFGGTVDIGAFEVQPPPNTTPGTNVTTTSPSGDAKVTFPEVTTPGDTTFAPIDPPSSAGSPPPNFTIVNDAPAYDITTTASYTPPLTVCFTVSSINTAAEFARVRILHGENGVLVDRTIMAPGSPAPDFATRTVCARVDSLSPFAVALAPAEEPPPSPTPTPTATPSATPTPTATATPTPTATATPTPTASPSPSATPEPSASPSATPTPSASPTPSSRQLLNIATRLRVQTGENVLIGGLIVTGNVPKKVIIRAIGPSLSGVFDGALADTTLELYRGETLLAANDNWKDSQQAEIEQTTIPPEHDLESAIVYTLDPGFYTAVMSGKAASTGIGVIEVYDLDQAAHSKVVNIASRGFVEAGDDVMIGGLIVGGNGIEDARILLRAIGPSLREAGVADALQDPTLELRDANGDLLRVNDDWQQSQQSEIEATTIPPHHPAESAMIVTLPPGNYTAVVRGKNDTTGVGLVEVYNVP